MIDPIEEEMFKKRRVKLYQQYQNHVDAMDKKDKLLSEGDLGGKKVKKTISESAITDLFHGSIAQRSF